MKESISIHTPRPSGVITVVAAIRDTGFVMRRTVRHAGILTRS